MLLGERVEGGIGGNSGQCNDAAGPKVSRALSVVQTWVHISRLVNKRVHTHTHTYRHTHTHPALCFPQAKFSLKEDGALFPMSTRGQAWLNLGLSAFAMRARACVYYLQVLFCFVFPLWVMAILAGWLWVSQVALVVKNPPATAGDIKRQRLDPWV